MKRILVIRPSSLGDIVHSLPIVHDLHRHRDHFIVDWVAEESFAALPAMSRGVHRVIPVALRRWRHRLLAIATWRELGAFRRQVRRERYDVVLDLQEQVKGAAIALLARGPVHGPDRQSIHEPIASMVYRQTYRVDPNQHLLDRCRQLAGKAFGYAPEGLPQFDLKPPPFESPVAGPYIVVLHASSRTEKLWPETHWRTLIAHFARAGFTVFLPWGNAQERERSERLAAEISGTVVPPRFGLPQLAALLAGAELVCGVDTGLVHLAAALQTPTIALFVATSPLANGAGQVSASARDLGDDGAMPTPELAIAEAAALLRDKPGC